MEHRSDRHRRSRAKARDGRRPTCPIRGRTRDGIYLFHSAEALAALVLIGSVATACSAPPRSQATRASAARQHERTPTSLPSGSTQPPGSTRPTTATTTPSVSCGRPGYPPNTATPSAPAAISAIQFVSRDVGWAVGAAIWSTTDGGTSWYRQEAPGTDFSSVDAVDAEHAWVVSVEDKSIVTTSNGGRTWVSLAEPSLTVDTVHFVSSTVGIAVAGGTLTAAGIPECNGVLLRTDNGGQSWRRLPSPGNVQTACFSTPTSGWLSAGIAGHADIYRSVDGGTAWQRAFAPPLDANALEDGFPDAATAEIQCAQGAVWAVYLGLGPGASNQFPWFAYHGTPSGRWTPVFVQSYAEGPALDVVAPEPPAGYPGPFSALSATSAVFVGDNVVIPPFDAPVELATDDGAALGTLGATPHITSPSGSSFVSSRIGWVAGEDQTGACASRSGTSCPWLIDATSNGGHTWHTQLRFTP